MYRQAFGHWPDLQNPKTFNEKIAWRKLFERDPLMTQYADKIRAKELVEELVGPEVIIPTLAVADTPSEMPLETLSAPYVLKVSNGWSANIFCRERPDSPDKIRARLQDLLARPPHGRSTREWVYYGTRPRLLAERMIFDEGGSIPKDYKLHNFGGETVAIQVDLDRFGSHKRNLYSPNWELLHVRYVYENGPEVPRPKHLSEMLRIAAAIGGKFSYARIDFYDTADQPFFGEVTFCPEAGRGHFMPSGWDRTFGERWITRRKRHG